MPGRRGQGFSRRRGMRIRRSRNATMGRDLLEWMKSRIEMRNKPDQTNNNRASIEDSDSLDELTGLRQQAESVQNQLKEINTRILEMEKKPNSPFARIDDTACTGCGRCVQICPQRAITLANNISRVDQIKCTGCGICISECPVGAIDLIR